MNYIVYDLEFNQKPQDFKADQYYKSHSLPFEIIQIGALKLNEKLETLTNFNALIKPNVYPKIHPFVEKLTGIDNRAVSLSKSFTQVYDEFIDFICDEDTVLCIWGSADIRELIKNIEFYNLSAAAISKSYIDIQKYASEYFEAPKDSRISLKTAINLFNLPIIGEFHDAFNDAYYTAEVFKCIFDGEIKPQIFIPVKLKTAQKVRERVDTFALIKQFEKMYDREMSEEEKAIIMLAYNMGRTKQFTIRSE